MKQRNKETKPDVPVLVEITLSIPPATALWLIEIAELHGDAVQNIAANILNDVARDDMLAHEELDGTVH